MTCGSTGPNSFDAAIHILLDPIHIIVAADLALPATIVQNSEVPEYERQTLIIRSAAIPSPPGEFSSSASPRFKSKFPRIRCIMSASLSSIVTGQRKLVKNDTTGRPSSFSIASKKMVSRRMQLICLSKHLSVNIRVFGFIGHLCQSMLPVAIALPPGRSARIPQARVLYRKPRLLALPPAPKHDCYRNACLCSNLGHCLALGPSTRPRRLWRAD